MSVNDRNLITDRTLFIILICNLEIKKYTKHYVLCNIYALKRLMFKIHKYI